jgi:hypothetical protein
MFARGDDVRGGMVPPAPEKGDDGDAGDDLPHPRSKPPCSPSAGGAGAGGQPTTTRFLVAEAASGRGLDVRVEAEEIQQVVRALQRDESLVGLGKVRRPGLLRGVRAHGVRSVTERVSRTRALAIHAEAGLIYCHCDKALELWPIAERELLSLALRANDDIPDALAYATNGALGDALGEALQPARLRFG